MTARMPVRRTAHVEEWQAETAGDDPDVFQAELLAWTAHPRRHPGGRHVWNR